MIAFYFVVGTILLLIGYIVGLRDKEFKSFQAFLSKHSLYFRVLIAFVLLAVLLGSAIYIQRDVGKSKFDIAEVGKYIVGGLVVIGLLYTILTYEFTVKQSKENKRSQLSQSTFSILSAWYNTPIVDYSKTVSLFENGLHYADLKHNIDSFIVWFDSDDDDAIELRRAIGGIFNYFEIICTGIKEEIIDEQFVRRYFEEVFNDYYSDWIGHIKKRRETNAGMFSEFTILVENWIEN